MKYLAFCALDESKFASSRTKLICDTQQQDCVALELSEQIKHGCRRVMPK